MASDGGQEVGEALSQEQEWRKDKDFHRGRGSEKDLHRKYRQLSSQTGTPRKKQPGRASGSHSWDKRPLQQAAAFHTYYIASRASSYCACPLSLSVKAASR